MRPFDPYRNWRQVVFALVVSAVAVVFLIALAAVWSAAHTG